MPNIPEMPQPAQEGGDIEQMLAQLSPEELQQLAAQLGSEMQDPSASAGGDEVSELANAIEQHLAQNPEAAVAGAEPEKMAALRTVKSAGYIEGFIHQAVMGGANLKQAVDMYDNALTSTILNLKQAALKGDQHKLDLNNNGKIDSSDLKNLRHEKSETPTQEKKEHMNNDMEEVKEAAYYEGVFERAAEYGLSKQAAAELINKLAFGLGDAAEAVNPTSISLGNSSPAGMSAVEQTLKGLGDFSKSLGGANNPFLLANKGGYEAANHIGLDSVDPSTWLGNMHLNANTSLQDTKLEHLIKQLKGMAGPAALGLGAAGLGAGAYALGKKNKEKKGSLEDELALHLGQGLPENPNMLGGSLDLGNISPSGLSDAESQLASGDEWAKGMGGANNPFLPANRGGSEHVGIDSVNPETWDQESRLNANTSLQDTKLEHLIRKLKGMARPAAYGAGAAGLGAGAYALANRKKKND